MACYPHRLQETFHFGPDNLWSHYLFSNPLSVHDTGPLNNGPGLEVHTRGLGSFMHRFHSLPGCANVCKSAVLWGSEAKSIAECKNVPKEESSEVHGVMTKFHVMGDEVQFYFHV